MQSDDRQPDARERGRLRSAAYTAVRTALRTARRGLALLPLTVKALAGRGTSGRPGRLAVPRALLALVPALVALFSVGLAVFVGISGYLYPIRPDVIEAIGHPFTADSVLDNAWGGPTLAGAWLVHALVALAIQVVALVLVHAMTRVWERLTGVSSASRVVRG
ncbi:hypothetical protein MTQ01_22580 [Streptomyces sp. XM4193]|uniref:hypothetical protein n=1 Tax=Streptomyces sp. XM4193 TaxID=2929782 RepID=UPI001FF76B92|nr:hypothetical protein [Streptomyces sp. XM4193]MCK1798761.1 hypothetical protein [Streptomyces sp. XM4193]